MSDKVVRINNNNFLKNVTYTHPYAFNKTIYGGRIIYLF